MSIVSTVLFFYLIGTLGAWRPDIDVNRVRLLPKTEPHVNFRTPHSRRSIFPYRHINNDYDDYSRGIPVLPPKLQALPDELSPSKPQAIKVHKSREDPRLFYLSDVYAKEINDKHFNNEVSEVYPGQEVIHANDRYYHYNWHNRHLPSRLKTREMNNIYNDYPIYNGFCVKCPHDITLVVKAGSDRVLLPYARLQSCLGQRTPKGAQFVHMFGPKFGSLLEEGSYSIIGRILYNKKILKHCFMEVHVLAQTCPLPNYLVAQCDDQNKMCNFTCRDEKTELHGPSHLHCGNDNKWIGTLPICKASAPNWCKPPSPPQYGRVSCRGKTVNEGGLAEGSTCRVRCARGWSRSRAVAYCREGSWTRQLACTPQTE